MSKCIFIKTFSLLINFLLLIQIHKWTVTGVSEQHCAWSVTMIMQYLGMTAEAANAAVMFSQRNKVFKVSLKKPLSLMAYLSNAFS